MPSCWKYHGVPVRPSPVCTSSMIRSAPCFAGGRGDRLEVAGLRRWKAEGGRDRLEDDGGGALVDDLPQSTLRR